MNTELDDLIGVDYGEEYYPSRQMTVIKKDGTADPFNVQKVLNAVSKSAFRASVTFTEVERRKICENIISRVDALSGTEISIAMMHNIVEQTLDLINPVVAKSYRDYRNYKQDFVKMLDEVYKKSQSIMYIGDKENSNTDSALVSTKRSLVLNQLNKELYKKFFLTTEELQACNDGYIYIHDMSARRDTMNCCLCDVGNVLKGGFEMGNVWYNEPKTLDTAFDVIGDIVLSGASQQYGDKTIYHIDKTIQENGVTVDEGLHEVFVNTKIKDGTKISHLMELFAKTQFESKEFPALSKRVNFLKTSEGGKTEMDTVMGKLLKEERAEVTNKAIRNMIDLGLSKDKILTKYTVEEYETALKSQKTE